MKKIWNFKTRTVPVIMGALGMIKKRTDKYINKITGSILKYKKKNAELIIFQGEYNQCDWKKRGNKKNMTVNTYKHFLLLNDEDRSENENKGEN